jgi:hypothetical protein
MRKFWPASLVTRIWSVTGLKSKPNSRPRSGGPPRPDGPTTVAAPVAALMVYSRPKSLRP